ncbi:MAG: 2Fe-2S iron-sulfur cluster-binding protein [Candidatus Aminicenantaceae bacterium]
MANILIDDKPVEAQEGTTILLAAEQAGIPIPHLCFHRAFTPEGSCRMCLVEIEGFPKLELACSTQVKEGMKIWTKSERVVEARKGVLEFLLAEHPLDCPICDKAGECKLQDYYEEYGHFESQFKEYKEKKEKKLGIGKNLILDRERCILCTRCIRFLREITKTQELGMSNRGLHSEIDIYEKEMVDNHYSGNLAEICPVGAITDTDFRFKTRSWFLKKGDSICPLCSRGCNISIEYHPGFPRIPIKRRVYRITSRENPEVNSHWICDLGRYTYSYLDEDRLEDIISNNSNKGVKIDWENALQFLVRKIKKLYYMKKTSRIFLIFHSSLTNEELFLVNKIFREDLKLEKIFMVDSNEGEGDDFLLSSERSSNRKGAQVMGIDSKLINLEEIANKTDILIIFGNYLLDHFSPGEIKTALDKIETTILFTSWKSELDTLVDLVLPTALVAEKRGSLTNIDGRVQYFLPVLEPVGASLPEWEILVRLAKELKMNFTYYRQFKSPDKIFEKLEREIPFFSQKKND